MKPKSLVVQLDFATVAMSEFLVIPPFSLGDITHASRMATSRKVRRSEWRNYLRFPRTEELALAKLR